MSRWGSTKHQHQMSRLIVPSHTQHLNLILGIFVYVRWNLFFDLKWFKFGILEGENHTWKVGLSGKNYRAEGPKLWKSWRIKSRESSKFQLQIFEISIILQTSGHVSSAFSYCNLSSYYRESGFSGTIIGDSHHQNVEEYKFFLTF